MGWIISKVLEIVGIVKTVTQLYIVASRVDGIVPAVAYAANDAVGGLFQIAVPKIGIIEGFKLIDPDDDTLALTAHLFSRRVAVAADNAAFTISADDSLAWVTSVTFDAPLDIGGAKVAEEVGTSYYEAPDGLLWCQCSTTGTPTIAAGKIPILVLCIRVGAKE